jgi:hypothetical protein
MERIASGWHIGYCAGAFAIPQSITTTLNGYHI